MTSDQPPGTGPAQAISQDDLWSASPPADRAMVDPEFTIDVDGFEGPLDVLLTLARNQKVDLAKISILQLAEQYLEFIEEVRRLRGLAEAWKQALPAKPKEICLVWQRKFQNSLLTAGKLKP